MSTEAIAFVDLLGSSYYALHHPPKYQHNLDLFRDALLQNSGLLNVGDRVRYQNDTVYIGCSKFESLVAYLRAVRGTLLDSNIYLQGAITAGTLDERDIHDLPESASNNKAQRSKEPTQEEKALLEKRRQIVQGVVFGKDITKPYAAHYTLKGIAVRVDAALLGKNANRAMRHKECVVSCHLPHPKSPTAEWFWDLGYAQDELDGARLRAVFTDCIRMRSEAKTSARYYVPLFITVIRSMNWESVDCSKSPEADPNPDARMLLEWLVGAGTWFEKNFGDLRGIEYIYFTLLDELHRRCATTKAYRRVQLFVAKRQRFLNALERVGPEILSSDVRETFLKEKLFYVPEKDEKQA